MENLTNNSSFQQQESQSPTELGGRITSQPPTPKKSSKHLLVIAILVVLIIAVLGVVGWWVWNRTNINSVATDGDENSIVSLGAEKGSASESTQDTPPASNNNQPAQSLALNETLLDAPFSHSSLGFTIRPPKGWKVSENEQGVFISNPEFYTVGDVTYIDRGDVIVAENTRNQSLESIAADIKKNITGASGVKVYRDTPVTTASGLRGHLLDYDHINQSGPKETRSMNFITTNAGRIYVIGISGDPDKWEQENLGAAYESVLASFSIQ
jgi:hypothetical protein